MGAVVGEEDRGVEITGVAAEVNRVGMDMTASDEKVEGADIESRLAG